jgi:flagellar biosynthesis/type III secretory pathway ATPase
MSQQHSQISKIRSLALALCGEEYNPKKANALLLLMDDIQRHADARETGEVITASIITKEVAFSKLDRVMDTHIESLRKDT